MKAAFFFSEPKNFLDTDARISVSGGHHYVNIRVGDSELLLNAEDARELIFKLHSAIKDHLSMKNSEEELRAK